MDTVQLAGKHFTSNVKVGQIVRRGDVLAKVDWAAVAAAGYDLTTPVVVTNAAEFDGVRPVEPGEAKPGDPLFTVGQKEAARA